MSEMFRQLLHAAGLFCFCCAFCGVACADGEGGPGFPSDCKKGGGGGGKQTCETAYVEGAAAGCVSGGQCDTPTDCNCRDNVARLCDCRGN